VSGPAPITAADIRAFDLFGPSSSWALARRGFGHGVGLVAHCSSFYMVRGDGIARTLGNSTETTCVRWHRRFGED
jgi:hypothetical protein